jgi:hypothetical protein
MKPRLLVPLLASALFGCPNPRTESKTAASVASAPSTERAASQPASPASQPQGASSQPAQGDITRRVEAAKARLSSTPTGQLVLKATEAHGGLQAWFSGRALEFRYDYQPVQGTRRNSLQTIDLLSARAYHDLEHPTKGKLAFDGKEAWMKLEGEGKFAARFWALTPYYFVGMPFVLSDPGVRLQLSPDTAEAAGLPPAHVVRASFDPGTGDAPDDYYVVYIAKDDHRVLAVRYVVSYAPFFKGKPMKSTPEKLLVYEDLQAVGPLKLSSKHVFYKFPEGKRAEKVTVADVSGFRYGAPFDEQRLAMPKGAVVDEAL